MTDLDRIATVSVVKNGDDVVIECEGTMDLHNSKEFHDVLVEASCVADNLVVDLLAVAYIDTAILADLAVAANKMIARGKRLKVKVTEPSHPLRTLQITGFSAILDVLISTKEEPAA